MSSPDSTTSAGPAGSYRSAIYYPSKTLAEGTVSAAPVSSDNPDNTAVVDTSTGMTRQPGRSAVTRFLEPVRTLLTDATFDTNVPETPRLSCKIIRPPQSGSEVDQSLKKFEGELTLDEGTELMCLKFPPSASQITCDGLTIQPDTAVAESL
ncbi:hypothetical protein I316_03536 [Kwoniella heveanensis BCC8398]|uniref:Uncharacterized protein n=1 Tax=Kwoniella heveanensis BCC8398 TaxID=1296120 RepID=A0A1B9GVE1_9TREE|nr:hypothetical protein I316_03536 [Kwoniella heveanensis BCC8398]